MTTKKTKARSSRRREADDLTALLNEAAAAPSAPPEVLVPGTSRDWVGDKVERLKKIAATPKGQLLGQAEQALVRQARRLLKANEEHGLSLSGLVRTGARLFFSVPSKRQDR
jgi:hypothetical protein